ncbi:hypothetical protein QYF61_007149, partial [Mycteria americana]
MYFKDPKGYRWAFGIAALEMEEIKQLSTLPGLSEDASVVGLLRVEEQQVPTATTTVHWRQYLESQGAISKTCSPFNSPIWPVQKYTGEWRLTVDYCGLNEVMPPPSAAVPDMLELQYELGSKAAKWYATTDIANVFFSIPLAAEWRPPFAFTWRGVQYTWNRLPQGWKHSPAICHGLIQTALEQAEEVFEKGKKIVQILLKAGFAIKQSKVKGLAQEIHFLGIKWQDGHCQIPMDVINKITAMSPPSSKKETQAFLGICGFLENAYSKLQSDQVVGAEAQFLLAPRLPVLGWMFTGRVPSTHQATDATWSKWVTQITQQAEIGNPSHPGILELIMDWPEGKDFGISPEEEAPLYNKLQENEKPYALFTDGSFHLVGKHRRWKAAVWSPTRQVVETAEGEGESNQFAEVKAIQLALDTDEGEKWPILYCYTDSWMTANALWWWLQQWKQSNWQHRGKPIWAAALWQGIAARVENLVVKVHHGSGGK